MTSLAKQLAEAARVQYQDDVQRKNTLTAIKNRTIYTIKNDSKLCAWDSEFQNVVVEINCDVPSIYCCQEIPCEPELKSCVLKELEKEFEQIGFTVCATTFSGYTMTKIYLRVV